MENSQILILSLLVLVSGFYFSDAFADIEITTGYATLSSPGCAETNQCYNPGIVTINVGEKVIMTNTDSTGIHTFTSGIVDGFAANPDGAFDSGMLMSGDSFEWTPNSSGVYPYYCSLHVWMQGLVTVQEAQAEEVMEEETIPLSVSVWTDRASYSEGDTIIITGKVSQLLGGYLISLTVIAPDGNLVSIEQLTIGADKKFSSSTTAGGALWKSEGTYTVVAQYGDNKNNVGVTTFEFSGSSYIPPVSSSNGVTDTTVSVSGSSDLIGYAITGGKLLGITPDVDVRSLIISIYASNDGSLTLAIPRSVLDAKIGNSDDDFFVLVNGDEVDFDETTTYSDRILTIAFPAGATEIEIIGTQVGSKQPTYTPPTYTPPTYTPPTSYSGKISASGITVSYSITGGKLLAITPDSSANSLIISIDATNDGSVTLTIPRTLLDATINGRDDNFFVLIDREEVDFNEKTTSSTRMVTIEFPSGSKQIEIIGTFVKSGSSYYPTPYVPTPYVPTPHVPTPTPHVPTPTPYVPALPVPAGMNIVIPSGTGAPGCEETKSCYEPRVFTAGKGSTITWFNSDSAAHTVTGGTPDRGPSGGFDSGLFMSGESFSHKFNKDGTYPYFCMIHPWMEGKVSIQRGGPIFSAPTPIPTPTPTPTTGRISVSTDATQYSPSDLVTVKVSTSKSANVAISVIGPNGDSIVSRSVTTDFRGSGSLQFKLPDSSQNGSYRIDTTATISGSKVSDSTSFTVKSTSVRVSITSLQPTDQQGNTVSSFTKGKLGFAKIVLNSDASVTSLVTINLFDSDLTSLGIGSFKTTLSSGQSEMTLSFFIPNDASFGSGDIYANVFSDWPSQGGVPLTGESAVKVRIQ